jgi:hypothetical protein
MLTCVASLLNSLPVSLTNELIQEKPEVDWGKLGCLFGDEGSCEHFSLLEEAKKKATAVVVFLDLAAASYVTTQLRRSLTGGGRAVAASRSLPY